MQNYKYLFQYLFISIYLLNIVFGHSENLVGPFGEGTHFEDVGKPLTPEQRQYIKEKIRENKEKLGLNTTTHSKKSPISYQWPLLPSPLITDPGYWAISNYIDENPAVGQIEDYYCGTRTYDGHRGTDFVPYPYYWYKMDNNLVSVVAAAPGVIILKEDGNFDRSCTMATTSSWNAVYLRHIDGSQSWYGHLKIGITSKTIGESVAAGDWLGYVGSSGGSSGPHLHLELYDGSDNLIDPWAGPCNFLGGQSWWQNQIPYYNPALLKLHTASNVPSTGCSYDITYEQNVFLRSDTVYFVSWWRDYDSSEVSYHYIIDQSGSIREQWSHSPPQYYEGSYWYWYYSFPQGPEGLWTYRIQFLSQTVDYTFSIENKISTTDGTTSQTTQAQTGNIPEQITTFFQTTEQQTTTQQTTVMQTTHQQTTQQQTTALQTTQQQTTVLQTTQQQTTVMQTTHQQTTQQQTTAMQTTQQQTTQQQTTAMQTTATQTTSVEICQTKICGNSNILYSCSSFTCRNNRSCSGPICMATSSSCDPSTTLICASSGFSFTCSTLASCTPKSEQGEISCVAHFCYQSLDT